LVLFLYAVNSGKARVVTVAGEWLSQDRRTGCQVGQKFFSPYLKLELTMKHHTALHFRTALSLEELAEVIERMTRSSIVKMSMSGLLASVTE
jgi:hypothetical protein